MYKFNQSFYVTCKLCALTIYVKILPSKVDRETTL